MPLPVAQWMIQVSRTRLGANPQPNISQYVDRVSSAISGAITIWQLQAKFQNVKIMSVSAIGPRGCLKGPGIGALVTSTSPLNTDWERQMSAAVGSAVGSAWASYEQSVMVPGLPWYPAFAAYPGPMAPPMPNVPTPFMALPQNSVSTIKNSIQQGIKSNASALPYGDEVANAVAAGFTSMFLTWLAGVMVKNVMGKGPVPSFAPPYVPVGPVVNGDVLPIPGVLA